MAGRKPGSGSSREKAARPTAAFGIRRRRGLAILLVAVVVLLGVALAYMASRPGTDGAAAGHNVLLITLDTTRADHLGCYGNSKGLTPNIDGLARAGTLFEQCTASAPITLPSHATLLTGVHPYVHGVRHNTGSRLAERNETLAEVLAQAGYACGAYVSAMVLNRDTGLDQGFATYDDLGKRHERPADEVTAAALAWLNQHAADTFFLWVHYFDPHAPYDPPASFSRPDRTPYEGEIAFTDAQVGRVLEALDDLGLADTTLVVLTADHGEGLGEHGEETHLNFVYDTTMSVPLVFRAPARVRAGKRVAAQAGLVDVAPTILSFLGLAPGDALPSAQGTDLVPSMAGWDASGGSAASGDAPRPADAPRTADALRTAKASAAGACSAPRRFDVCVRPAGNTSTPRVPSCITWRPTPVRRRTWPRSTRIAWRRCATNCGAWYSTSGRAPRLRNPCAPWIEANWTTWPVWGTSAPPSTRRPPRSTKSRFSN